MGIPILQNHDPFNIVGSAKVDGNSLVVEFRGVEVTDDQFFHIFGNCGYRVLESEDKGKTRIIRKAVILEFSHA